MFFNDDNMLDFRGNGFGEDVMDAIFGGPVGFDAGEVIITGRAPGSLYVDDFSDAQMGLEHIRPLEFAKNELSAIVTLDVVDLSNDADPTDPVAEDAPATPVAANDDESPAALVLASDGKDAEPLVLIPADGDGDESLVQLDPLDLAIPPLPVFETPTVTVTPPTFDDDDAPVVFGRAYQSLAFLILDTPYVVGDDNLPPTLRPPINELLGLLDADDGQNWVLPLGGAGSWRLG
jgi:hypothetical protein